MAAPDKVQTTSELERILASARVEQHRLGESISDRRGKIRTLTDEQVCDEKDLRRVEHRIMQTTNRIFARTALEPKVLSARQALLEKMKRSRSDQITVAKQKTLGAEIQADLAALQGLCAHRFVFSHDGYGGSYSMDNDDAFHGHRICALCNLRETSKGTEKDVYEILVEDGTRLVRRDLRDKKDKPLPFEREWFPAGFLQQIFEASAGDININWPAEKSPALKV